jgi:beta-N-acetylhexosaminidase
MTALLHVIAAVAAAVGGLQSSQVSRLTPEQKAALVVVSGLPAPAGVGGVIVQGWSRTKPRPADALVFTDQEGGKVKTFPTLPPWLAASQFRTASSAFASGRSTGATLRRAGVHVDFAPVLDGHDGPLGSREFRTQAIGVAFARGLLAAGAGACAKHFPGLGSTTISTDERPHVNGIVRPWEVAGFRSAIKAGVPCVMVSNAFYAPFGQFRASISPGAYRLLRAQGFKGVAITDSLSIVRSAPVERWARQASRAGADMLLFTSPSQARRAIAALVPLARRGELDLHVARVLALRRKYGLPLPPKLID